MKRFIPLILLAINFPIQAFEIRGQDDIIGHRAHKDTPEQKIPLTFGLYEANIKQNEPDFHNWCEKKGVIAVSALNGREKDSRQEVLDTIDEAATKTDIKVPHFKLVDLHRIVNDVYRYQANGNWRISATDEKREWLYAKEFQNCLINGF